MKLVKGTKNETTIEQMKDHLQTVLSLNKPHDMHLFYTDDYFEIEMSVLGKRSQFKIDWPVNLSSRAVKYLFDNKTEFALYYTSMILSSIAR